MTAVTGGQVFYPHYWSTYCIHGRHDECRLTCKTCQAPCLCTCHSVESDGEDTGFGDHHDGKPSPT